MHCIIDCTELFCSRPSSPLKVPFIQLKASCYIEMLDRNHTIWSSNFYQFYITKIYFRQKIVRRSSWTNGTFFEKNCNTRAHWGFWYQLTCKYWCNTEYTSLFRRLLTINKTRSEKSQAVTITVKIYFDRKTQSVKEFYQIGKEIPLILHGSVNQIWIVALLRNVVSLLIVKDNKRNRNMKNVKWNA